VGSKTKKKLLVIQNVLVGKGGGTKTLRVLGAENAAEHLQKQRIEVKWSFESYSGVDQGRIEEARAGKPLPSGKSREKAPKGSDAARRTTTKIQNAYGVSKKKKTIKLEWKKAQNAGEDVFF